MTPMVRTAAVLLLSVAVGGGCGGAAGGDSHASLADENADLVEEMIALLERVTDRASAAAVRSELRDLANRAEALQVRRQRLDEPDAATRQAVEEQFRRRMQPLMDRLMPLLMKFGTLPEIRTELEKAMKNLKAGG